MHDLDSNTHNLITFEDETKQFKVSASGIEDSRQICILREFDFEISSSYFSLLEVAFRSNSTGVVYTDFSTTSEFGLVGNQIRLPSWSPERFLSVDYLGPLIAFDFSVLSKFKESNSVITRSSIILTCIEFGIEVNHVAEFGYLVPLDSFQESNKLHPNDVKSFLNKNRPGSKVESEISTWSVVSNSGIAPNLISVIIPTRGAKKSRRGTPLVVDCIRSIASQNLGNSRLEIVVVYDSDVSTKYLNDIMRFESKNIDILPIAYDLPFNFSEKCNLGARNASGEVLLFLNDDTWLRSANSILELAGTAMIANVGAVGAKLFFENERLQHAGYILRKGFVGHAYFRDVDSYGPFGDLVVPHEVVGVTGACFAQRKEVWLETGGWDESLPAAYNDVDYCFRIRSYGYSIIQNNLARLFHYESITRNPVVKPEETALILARWKDSMLEEPYFRTEVMNVEQRSFKGSIVQEYSRYIESTYRHAGLVGVVRIFANGFKKLIRAGNRALTQH